MIILWFKCDGLEDWVRDLLTKTWDLISGLLTPNKTHFLLNTCALYKWDFSIMHGCTHSTQVSFLPPFIINWFGHPFKPLQPNILSLDFREDLHMEQRKRCWNEPSSGDLRLNIYFTKLESSWTVYTENFSIGLCVALFFILVRMKDYFILSVISNIFKYSLLEILKGRREKCLGSHSERKLLKVSGHKAFYLKNWFSSVEIS